MPPAGVMGRVFFLFLLIAVVGVLIYFIIIYLLKPKADIITAKVEAVHIVDEANTEVVKEKIYKNASEKIKNMRNKR